MLRVGQFAWNSPGHIIIALIAYDHLDPATRTKAVELLRAHPRFNDHFEGVMPREVKRGNDQRESEWVFAHAARGPIKCAIPKKAWTYQDVSQFSRPFLALR